MGDDKDDSDALDRAAILARRQRFIALALTGLAAACGDDNGGPTPCLDVAPQTESSSVTGPSEGDTTASGSSGNTQPCLSPPTQTSSHDDTSGTAEATASTGTDTGESTGTGDESSSSGSPLPCLDVNPGTSSTG